MKEFDFHKNLTAALNGFTLLSEASHFKTLLVFGFKVGEVTLKLFSDNVLVHFHGFCVNQTGTLKEIDNVNALNFYNNLLETNDVSPYCSFCVRNTVLSSGDTSVWRLKSPWLTNMVLYKNEPITNLRVFHTVSLALHQFKKAVNVLKEIFVSEENNWFDQIIKIQSLRLKTAKTFFLADETFLISQLKEMITDSEMLNVLKVSECSDSFFVCPWDIFAFDYGAAGKFRSLPELAFENKILDVLELLFLNSTSKFLFAREVFLKLWCHVTLNSFKFNSPRVEVPVPVSTHGEFMETFTVLTKGEGFIKPDFHSNETPFSFDTAKVSSFVELSKNLMLN